MKFVECVPNFSEGLNLKHIEKIVSAMTSVPGVILLDKESDKDHNRSVITIVGEPSQVVEGAFKGISKSLDLIDLTKHKGEHPRMGATDVCPFIPISNTTMDECVELAKQLGERVATELKLPVYLYEEAATRPDRQNLAVIRKGQFEVIRDEIQSNPDRKPDYGPKKVHPTGGVIAIGARYPLIAYNVYLGTNDVEIAKAIGRAVRHSGGGLRFVKAMGFYVAERAQVSMNLVNYEGTPIYRVYELIKAEAARWGVPVIESEVVGLVPQAALNDSSDYYLKLNNFSRNQILEIRLQEAINEHRKLVDLTVHEFNESLASADPTPGGGTASALSSTLGAGLGTMVLQLTTGKEKFAKVETQVQIILKNISKLRIALTQAIDDDTNAFKEVLLAFKLPNNTSKQKEKRSNAIQTGYKKAAEVPLTTAELSLCALQELKEIVKIGNPNAISDCGVGALLLQAGLKGAILNVRINLSSIKDLEYILDMKNKVANLETDAQAIVDWVLLKVEAEIN